MKLWVDDVREPPDDTWWWAKSSRTAIGSMNYMRTPFEELSLDHDLGDQDTTRPVVLWMCEHEFWPSKEIVVHSANPTGADWLVGTIDRYAPDEVELYRGPIRVARHSTH
jgi:hypothetical protein